MKHYKVGTNQYRKKTPQHWKANLIGGIVVLTIIALSGMYIRKEAIEGVWAQEPVLSPISTDSAKIITPTPTMTPRELQDKWIGEQADRFAKPQIGKSASYLRYQLHCLAYMENGHHANNNRGDGGLASGMYQYHEGTYEGFRKIMMREGLTHHMGSRDDDEDAIETTAWALSEQRDYNWGPIVNFNACTNAHK